MEGNEIALAMKQICEEKGITEESVLETIEAALAAAYRKDFGEKNQNVKSKFNLETGKIDIFDVKTVVEDMELEEKDEEASPSADASPSAKASGDRLVDKEEEGKDDKKPSAKKAAEEGEKEKKDTSPKKASKDEDEDDKKSSSAKASPSAKASGDKSADGEEDDEEKKKRFNPKTDIMISDAKEIKKRIKIGEEIITPLEIPSGFGRMAAQTAKQVIIQKLREAERDTMYIEYKDREGDVITGIIQRREGRLILIDLGKVVGLLPPEEQIDKERYQPGERYKFYIVSVNKTAKGPEVILSRSHPEMVRKIFNVEIPEIASDLIEIKSIAREAGSRTKIAVFSSQDNVDPIGSCVGQRGSRVQTIINELGGEKIDIIEYSDDPEIYIENALSPARIISMKVNEKKESATVRVKEDQLSLAIGKGGQNVRLAAKLSGLKIDMVTERDDGEEEEITEEGGLIRGAEEDAGEEDKGKEVEKEESKEDDEGESPKEETPEDEKKKDKKDKVDKKAKKDVKKDKKKKDTKKDEQDPSSASASTASSAEVASATKAEKVVADKEASPSADDSGDKSEGKKKEDKDKKKK